MKKIVINSFFTLFSLYILCLFLRNSMLVIEYKPIAIIEKIIRTAILALFLCRLFFLIPNYKKIIIKEKSKKEWFILIIALLFIIAGIVNFIIRKDIKILSVVLISLNAIDIEFKDICKRLLLLNLICTITIIFLTMIKINPDYLVMRGEIKRYSLGFTYTTILSQIVLVSSLLYLYVKDFKLQKLDFLFIQLMNLLAFYITNSKTEIIFCEVILIIAVCRSVGGQYFDVIKKSAAKIFEKIFVFIPILSLLVVCAYSNVPVITSMDSFFSNRLSQSNQVLNEHGITLFGSDFKMVGLGAEDIRKISEGQKSNYIDNEYLQILFCNGLIILVCIVLLIMTSLKNMLKKNKYKEIFIFIVYLMFSIINSRTFDLMYSPIPFLIVITIANEWKNSKREDINKNNGKD